MCLVWYAEGLVIAGGRVQSSLAAAKDHLSVFGHVVKVADLSNQLCLAPPCRLKCGEDMCVALKRCEGRNLRCVPKDVQRATRLQRLGIGDISESRRRHNPPQSIQREGKAF